MLAWCFDYKPALQELITGKLNGKMRSKNALRDEEWLRFEWEKCPPLAGCCNNSQRWWTGSTAAAARRVGINNGTLQ